MRHGTAIVKPRVWAWVWFHGGKGVCGVALGLEDYATVERMVKANQSTATRLHLAETKRIDMMYAWVNLPSYRWVLTEVAKRIGRANRGHTNLDSLGKPLALPVKRKRRQVGVALKDVGGVLWIG